MIILAFEVARGDHLNFIYTVLHKPRFRPATDPTASSSSHQTSTAASPVNLADIPPLEIVADVEYIQMADEFADDRLPDSLEQEAVTEAIVYAVPVTVEERLPTGEVVTSLSLSSASTYQPTVSKGNNGIFNKCNNSASLCVIWNLKKSTNI